VGDPLWGVGCGFALQGATWLVDAVGPALADGGSASAVDRAASKYARQHRRRLGLHQKMLIDASSGRDFNPVERLIYAGAARDPRVADRMWAYGTRNASPLALFSPLLLARAARARHRPVPG
jgi:menaquinone-9 beta-reductase